MVIVRSSDTNEKWLVVSGHCPYPDWDRSRWSSLRTPARKSSADSATRTDASMLEPCTDRGKERASEECTLVEIGYR